ncbi:MAG TPA: DUF420 domain-containing protein [Nitrospiria bacterium]|nr:DUF420 domain-containing protein [Nitrospiria bacterium]
MKALLTRPGFLGTYGTFGADVSFLMALFFTILFLIGWRLAKRRNGNAHHTVVLWGMVGMLIYFTLYYLARGLGALATEGKEGFGGPDWMYDYVFTPLLTIHILVVSVGLVMAVYMIILGFRTAVRKNGRRLLQAGRLSISPRAFYQILGWVFLFFAAAAILRWHSLQRLLVYVFGFLLVAVVLLIEKGIERVIPDGERRHRLIGTFTMVLYVIALVTSTTTYVLLYLIYPPKIPPM